jgi:hypothetical protein
MIAEDVDKIICKWINYDIYGNMTDEMIRFDYYYPAHSKISRCVHFSVVTVAKV